MYNLTDDIVEVSSKNDTMLQGGNPLIIQEWFNHMERYTVIQFLKNLVNKHTRTVFAVALLLVLVVVLNRKISRPWQPNHLAEETERDLFTERFVEPAQIHNDVIISSNMRSGSTFLSYLLGYRTDSFMFYEPFWSVTRWGYFRGGLKLCSTTGLQCRFLKDYEIPDSPYLENRRSFADLSLLGKVDWAITRILNCQFDGFENLIFDSTTARLADPSWNPYRNCRNQNYTKPGCIPLLVKPCTAAKHKVLKVIRVTVDMFETFLVKYPNLKVIHLFRDPRAIINSRMLTNWYKKIKSLSDVKDNAASLCDRMLHNIRAGNQLLANGMQRFRFMLYEDLIDNVELKRRILYDYLGMSHNFKDLLFQNIHEEIHKNQHLHYSSEVHNFTAWWRNTISWDVVQTVDSACSEVYELLGYYEFKSEAELRDLSIPHVKKPYFSALDFSEVKLFD